MNLDDLILLNAYRPDQKNAVVEYWQNGNHYKLFYHLADNQSEYLCYRAERVVGNGPVSVIVTKSGGQDK
jgi:hypothetical protein